MANRTSILVVAAAVAMLVASFSLQSEDARASESNDTAIAEIEAIKAAGWSGIDDAVAAAVAEIAGAIKNGNATSATNAGLNAVDSIYWSAVDDMALVAEQASWSEPVVAAESEAAGALEGRAAQAVVEINAAHDAWLAANWEWTAADVIADIEWWVLHGSARLDEIIAGYAVELGAAVGTAEATALRDEALEDVERSAAQTTAKLDSELARMPNDGDVRAAHAQALTDIQAASNAAQRAANELFEAFVDNQPPAPTTTTTSTPLPSTTTTTRPPVTTTTTTVPPTTTTLPPTTTTTAVPPPPSTTTTTLAPAALLPDLPPPPAQTLYMAELPAPLVLSSETLSSVVMTEDSDMATVGMVRRVVESQLPAGVSTVAAGPLVVLGLIIDAVRAAGALMAVPWLLLGIYMTGLLRSQRNPFALGGIGGSVGEQTIR